MKSFHCSSLENVLFFFHHRVCENILLNVKFSFSFPSRFLNQAIKLINNNSWKSFWNDAATLQLFSGILIKYFHFILIPINLEWKLKFTKNDVQEKMKEASFPHSYWFSCCFLCLHIYERESWAQLFNKQVYEAIFSRIISEANPIQLNES